MQSYDTLKPFRTKSGDTLEIIYLEELTAEVRWWGSFFEGCDFFPDDL